MSAPRVARVRGAELELWLLLAAVLNSGHTAASIALDERGAISINLDHDVEVEVVVQAAEGPVPMRLPITDLPKIAAAGVEILDIAPCEPMAYWQARARVPAAGRTFEVYVIDRRGLLAALPFIRQVIGLNGLVRSGVPQVNTRLRRAMSELAAQYGNNTATDMVFNTYSSIIGERLAELPAGRLNRWTIATSTPTQAVLSSSPRPRLPETLRRVADIAVAEISTEAYGAARPDLPSAIVGASIDAWADPDGPLEWHPVSDWTRRQATTDPTGEAALSAHQVISASRMRELVAHGVLTRTQAEIVVLVERGLSLRQIADLRSVDPSTISRTLARARSRLTKSDIGL